MDIVFIILNTTLRPMYILNVITGKTFISLLDSGYSLDEVKRIGRTGIHQKSHNQISSFRFATEKQRIAHKEFLEEVFNFVPVRYTETTLVEEKLQLL